jgi:hypothetical protein
MTASAPRLGLQLLRFIERTATSEPIAEVNRAVGREAERLGLPRPSYEQVRVLVHMARRYRALRPRTRDVLLDVDLQARPPEALIDHLAERRPRLGA